MVRILVLDDQAEDRKKLIDSIHKSMSGGGLEYTVVEFENSLSQDIYSELYDVYFLDIDMPMRDGFMVAKKIRQLYEDACLIFVTNHSNLVFKSFEVNPFQFIRKDEMNDDFTSAMKLLYAKWKRPDLYYSFSFRGEIVRVMTREIQYFEKYQNDIFMHTISQTYRYRDNLSFVEMQLNNPLFLRTHNSYLVNLDFVTQLSEKFLILNNKEIPVSRLKYREIKERYLAYLRSKV